MALELTGSEESVEDKVARIRLFVYMDCRDEDQFFANSPDEAFISTQRW